ncbi:MAG: threonylcarbamoyl-AMP synthase [Clostridia bacterium]|nr:threonylcarbamoyl-AMP synthase [Clostridia bacterium]
MKTLRLNSKNKNDLITAADILRNGGLVAIPTETVYGLAANALDGEAVKEIFIAKGRPNDNPLIVHVASLEEIAPLVEEVDPRLYDLAEKYWPGPLTVILKKSDAIPDEVSAGLDTVAIRMPSHPDAREIIRLSGKPLAAPSANASGRPSPTSVDHVITDLDGRIDAVIDGGICSVGVESTVVTLATTPPTLLRPGGITVEQLEAVLGKISVSPAVLEQLKEGEKAESPGMKYKHYAPKARVTIVKGNFESYKKFLLAQKHSACAVCFDGEGKYFENYIEYGAENDGASQAHGLFEALRKVDESGCETAFVRCPIIDGVGLAVYNRLIRSAAFRVIDLDISIPVIGLTGQTGAGKSTVALLLEENGIYNIDTDLLARKAVENPEVIASLADYFGNDIIVDGVLDRRELARRAFSDPVKQKKLNATVHPEVTRLAVEEIHNAEKSGAKAVLIDAALLFESDLTSICSFTVTVVADKEIRLERIMRRDSISKDDALIRMNAQKDEKYYTENADIVIQNNGENINDEIKKIIGKL